MDITSFRFIESTDSMKLNNKTFKLYNFTNHSDEFNAFVNDNFILRDDVFDIIEILGHVDINKLFDMRYKRVLSSVSLNIIYAKDQAYISLFHVELFLKVHHKLLLIDSNIDIYNSIVNEIHSKSRRRTDFRLTSLFL